MIQPPPPSYGMPQSRSHPQSYSREASTTRNVYRSSSDATETSVRGKDNRGVRSADIRGNRERSRSRSRDKDCGRFHEPRQPGSRGGDDYHYHYRRSGDKLESMYDKKYQDSAAEDTRSNSSTSSCRGGSATSSGIVPSSMERISQSRHHVVVGDFELGGGGARAREKEALLLPNCMTGHAPHLGDNFKRRVAASFSVESNVEEDQHRLEQRLKQIGFGKNTVAYDKYSKAVPKNARQGYNVHPRTPDAYEKVSKRLFDGKVKAWRRQLHAWDEKYGNKSEQKQIEVEQQLPHECPLPANPADSSSLFNEVTGRQLHERHCYRQSDDENTFGDVLTEVERENKSDIREIHRSEGEGEKGGEVSEDRKGGGGSAFTSRYRRRSSSDSSASGDDEDDDVL